MKEENRRNSMHFLLAIYLNLIVSGIADRKLYHIHLYVTPTKKIMISIRTVRNIDRILDISINSINWSTVSNYIQSNFIYYIALHS